MDINGDGAVNILDLVAIANAFGKAELDLNGDSVVNIPQVATNRFRTFQKSFSVLFTPQRGGISIENDVFTR